MTPDVRDISHSKICGSIKASELPSDDMFVSEPLEIKNQDINYPSDFCASYGAAEVAEDHEDIALVPEYSFAQAKKLLAIKEAGSDEVPDDIARKVISEFGLQLRDICMAGVNVGFLEREHDPFQCDTEERPARNFIADWRKWPAELDMFAAEHRQNSFLAVDGPHDTFDNFRMALFQNINKRQSILTGALWRRSWSAAPGGFVDTDTYSPAEPGEGHAFKVFGQMNAKGKLWLVAQLSDGPAFGDKGLLYFSREVVNNEFGEFGAFVFNDLPKETARYYAQNGINSSTPLFERFFKVVWNSLLALIKRI